MRDTFHVILTVYIVISCSIAELESHRDRVSRHSQGLMASLNEQRASTQKLAAQQELEVCTYIMHYAVLCSKVYTVNLEFVL